MSGFQGFKLKDFVKAQSAVGLRKLMFEKQLELKMVSIEWEVMHDGKDFYGWYSRLVDRKDFSDPKIENGIRDFSTDNNP